MLRAVQHLRQPLTTRRTYLQSPLLAAAWKHKSKKIKEKLYEAVVNDSFYSDHSRKNKKFESLSGNAYLLNKALKLLKEKYDAVAFVNAENQPLNIHTLAPFDLKYLLPKARTIFDNLLRIKAATGRQIDRNLALSLLGTNGAHLSNSHYIAYNVKELLRVDGDTERALYLCRIAAKDSAVIGMNLIMQWLLKHGKVDEALQMFTKRRKSGIPSDDYTYITLFHGIASNLRWGYPNRAHVFEAMKIFDKWKKDMAKEEKTIPTEGFNACLGVLVKDFKDRQALAWRFFDELQADKQKGTKPIRADSRTFTVLLYGIQRYFDVEKSVILKDKKVSKNERMLALMDLEAGRIKMYDIVMRKVKQSALPPKPTGDIIQDRELIKSWNARKIEIDMPLICTFLNSLCSNSSGTGVTSHLGSHYLYNQATLSILRSVSPDIEDILAAVKKVLGSRVDRPSEECKAETDKRYQQAVRNPGRAVSKFRYVQGLEGLDPTKVIAELDIADFNPEVTRPVKTRFSRELVPLIDFTRKTDPAQPAPEHSVSKYLLAQLFDCLVNMGKWNEFIVAYWYSMIRWGGLRVDFDVVKNAKNVAAGVLQGKEIKASERKYEVVTSIFDEVTLDMLVTKTLEDTTRPRKGLTQTSALLEVFALSVTSKFNPTAKVTPSSNTIQRIWQVLDRDIEYYSVYNEANHKDRGLSTISFVQLEDLAKNLSVLNKVAMDKTLKYTNWKRPSSEHYAKLNQLLKKVYSCTWSDCSRSETIRVHKLLVKGCIKYFKPQVLINAKEDTIEYPHCLETSMNYLKNVLKNADRLTGDDLALSKAFKKLDHLGPQKDRKKAIQELKEAVL
ncbi:hypothetical protein Cantr_02448 [Candida viswanathii]|uniref:Mitochondrial 15S rRNA processing factor CCM1 n=1 Tax=Candida viswanathii TaxID=5486 RepID=A0A367YQM7_9ASCO|nr:hypothetical protein Cantr_02448 [Candida viswanathii]